MLSITLGACPTGAQAPTSFRGLSGYPSQKEVLNCGRALHQIFFKPEAQSKENEATSPSKAIDFAAKATMDDKEDYYAMLGLQDLRYRATQEDIKRAYRQCVLKYHPDKMAQNAGQDVDEDDEDENLQKSDEDISDIPKPVRQLIEELLEKGKSDAQIRSNYRMEEYVEGNDVCPKGLENPEEKIARMRRVKEGVKASETEADVAFKALSNAMSTLSDRQKRRAYDSSDASADIDDSLPPDRKPKDDEDFFKTWTPVFSRNARWSNTSMPNLGTLDTAIEEVLDFYEAWFNMDSWRDFTLDSEDAFDLEDASCREERRWMERQNKKLGEKMKKDEKNRINTMIETCHKWDPRIIQYKEELKNAKKKAKQAKYADKEKAAEEAKKKAEEEAAAKKQADEEEAERKKVEKEQKEAAKKQLRRARKALRDAVDALGLDTIYQVKTQDICEAAGVGDDSKFTMEQITELTNQIGALGLGDDATPKVQELLEQQSGLLKMDNQSEAPKPAAPSVMQSVSKKDKDRKWGRDEMELLHKALIKFPPGTTTRWEKISDFIGTRSDAECQRKCAEMKNNFAANATGMSADNSAEFERAKAEASKGHGIKSGTGKALERGGHETGDTIDFGNQKPKPEESKAAPKQPGPKAETPAPKPENDKTSKADAPVENEWSVDQQKALEAAMAEFKTSTLEAKEKWKAIAEKVPGKTDKECIKRVKEIKALLAKGGK